MTAPATISNNPRATASWQSDSHARRRKYRYLISAAHHATWFLGKRFPGAFPLVFVLGYPKSGTSWACQLVAEYLRLPFPQHSILPIGFPAVVHGHELLSPKYPRSVYVMRDGRDVLVSLYFHLASDKNKGRQATAQGGSMAVKDEITRFVRAQLKRPTASRRNWAEHVQTYIENRDEAVLLRYEDLVSDGVQTLAMAMNQLSGGEIDLARIQQAVDKFSFRCQTGRSTGREDRSSYLRKGQIGDWANFFTREAAEVFQASCGHMLIAAGYENDDSWVSRFSHRAAA